MPFCLFIVRNFVFSGCLDESIVLLVSLVFSLCRRLSINVTLPAVAAERRAAAPLLRSAQYAAPVPAAVDRYFLPTGHSAANPPATAAAGDRQTNGQTNGRSTVRPYIDPVPHTRVDSINSRL